MYLDQLTFSGGRSEPCQPAYQVVATTSSPRVLFLPELVFAAPPTAVPLGTDAEEVATAEAGLREHMGAAHDRGRAARRDRGSNIIEIANYARRDEEEREGGDGGEMAGLLAHPGLL